MEDAPRGRRARFRAHPWGRTASGHAEQSATEDDLRLFLVVRDRRVDSIPEVIAVMDRIDRALPEQDGLKWFNLLYRTVTERVAEDLDAGLWLAPRWLERLVVVFADLYFDAIERHLGGVESAPEVWRALFDRRRRPGVAPVQYCLAGINAHINRDLPVAIVRAWEAERTTDWSRYSREYRDYNRVSELLDEVELAMINRLATGVFKTMSGLFGGAEGRAAMRVVRHARLLAWIHAIHLSRVGLGSDEGGRYVRALDVAAARYGRAMLTPTEV